MPDGKTIQHEVLESVLGSVLSIEDCKKLPTPRLLSYYKKHRHMRRIGLCSCCGELLTKKDNEDYKIANDYFDVIKNILDSREHVHRDTKIKNVLMGVICLSVVGLSGCVSRGYMTDGPHDGYDKVKSGEKYHHHKCSSYYRYKRVH